jgi:hypothetical protein
MGDQGWELGRSAREATSEVSGALPLKIFQPLLSIMAEIHDQFDTILILDFGSQVRS